MIFPVAKPWPQSSHVTRVSCCLPVKQFTTTQHWKLQWRKQSALTRENCGSCCLFGPKLRTKHNRKASHVSKAMFVSIICHTRNCWTSIFNLWKCQHATTAGMRWLSWWNDSVKNKSLAQPGKSRTQYHQYLNGKLICCHCLLSNSDISLYIQIHCIYTHMKLLKAGSNINIISLFRKSDHQWSLVSFTTFAMKFLWPAKPPWLLTMHH